MDSGASTAGAPAPREMQVRNPTLLMDLMAAATGPLHFLREFTQNACEAVAAHEGDRDGVVLWDVDWPALVRSGGRIRRLSVIDNGGGMTPDEILELIGDLFSSGKTQSTDANFGIGAKLSSARFSPAGVEYRSWSGGEGWMVVLGRTDSRRWGLQVLSPTLPAPECYLRKLDDRDRPPLLAGAERPDGTAVTFIGTTDQDDTYAPPSGIDGKSMWMRRYLNTRYFEMPHAAKVLIREDVTVSPQTAENPPDWTPGHAHVVHGARALLDRHSTLSGEIALSDARCRWWLLEAKCPRKRADASEWAAAGFTGVLYDGEIYDCLRPSQGGYHRLSTTFGVRTGCERVVLLLEPNPKQVTSDASRTNLQINGDVIPWSRWGAEFAHAMPEPIAALQLELLDTADSDARQSNVRQRWQKHAGPLVARVGGYIRQARRSRGDALRTAAPAPRDVIDSPSPGAPEELGRVTAPVTRRAPRLRYPKSVIWLPDDVPATGLLEDRAAHWSGPDDDVLTINPHFATYKALLAELLAAFANPETPGAQLVVAKMLVDAWEAKFVEALDMARRVAKDPEELAKMTAPESFMTLACELSSISQELRRLIALRLGPMKKARTELTAAAG